jgi:hypothetical protein
VEKLGKGVFDGSRLGDGTCVEGYGRHRERSRRFLVRKGGKDCGWQVFRWSQSLGKVRDGIFGGEGATRRGQHRRSGAGIV